MYPPSFDPFAKSRAFLATNGELGVRPDDIDAFIDACRRDGVAVLGWELWLVDHAWGNNFEGPVPAPGYWCGGIPTKSHDLPSVIGGDGDVDETERQLKAFGLEHEIKPEWLPHVRINFTLA